MNNAITAYNADIARDAFAGLMKPEAAKAWGDCLADWLGNLKSERTRAAYIAAWRDLLARVAKAPDVIAQGDIIRFRNALSAAGRAGSTINQKLSAISSFYDFAKGRELVATNPADGVNREKVDPYGKAVWLDVGDETTKGEDVIFLEQINTSTEQGKRDKAIMLLFLTGAFRVAELVSFRAGKLEKSGKHTYINYVRKGGIEERELLAEVAVEALDRYLATRGDLADDAPIFVATHKGRQAAAARGRYGNEDKPLTTRAINYLIKNYAKKAFGDAGRISAHSLRHTAAQATEAEGGTDADIGQLLKHSNMATTAIYRHATRGSAQKTADRLSRRYGGNDDTE